MRLLTFLCLMILASCGRPLSESEATFARKFHRIDTRGVRVVPQPLLKLYSSTSPTPPRITCAAKLLPPTKAPFITSSPAAMVMFNTINVNPDYFSKDYLPQYPDVALIQVAMFLAHEFVHVWQWQNRDKTGYHPLKAAREHQLSPDPYLFELSGTTDFLDYGYEQQGAIAGEYVCCAAIAPNAPRTKRLERLLAPYFDTPKMTPVLDRTKMVLPWDKAELNGICD